MALQAGQKSIERRTDLRIFCVFTHTRFPFSLMSCSYAPRPWPYAVPAFLEKGHKNDDEAANYINKFKFPNTVHKSCWEIGAPPVSKQQTMELYRAL
jgi:hypothetical protein